MLYWKTFKKLQIPEIGIQPYDDHIVGFSSERVDKRGCIDLYTKFRKGRYQSLTIKIRYLLIDVNMLYNIHLGRLSLNPLEAMVSSLNLAMKFSSVSSDIMTIHIDHRTASECYMVSLKVEPQKAYSRASSIPRSTKSKERTHCCLN